MDGTGFDFGHIDEAKHHRPLIIDSFAGGGGASTGIEMAIGRSPDIAINHDEIALSMHEKNHPESLHIRASVYSVDPADYVRAGQKVGLLWASPDCTHHSRAKGGKPLSSSIRDLAWVVVHYAERVAPEIIMLENVMEFADWGPLNADNRPDKSKKGETFRSWVERLRKLGYVVEWKVLKACDFGAPTIRKRLFLVARRDGKPIVWPKPTHAKKTDLRTIHGHFKPFRVASDVIDWSLPCPSIFDTSEEIMEKHGVRAIRPLAENTLKRIARGVNRYVIESSNPFIVVCNHAGDRFRGQSLDDPLATVTASRDGVGIVRPTIAPFISYSQHGGRSRLADIPLHTITASRKDQNLVVSPLLVNVANSKTTGRGPNCWDTGQPLRTLTSSPGFAVIAPHLMTMRNSQKPFSAGDEPVHTLTAGGAHMMAVSAFMAQHNGGERMKGAVGRSIETPVSTLTTRATQQTVIAASMMALRGTSDPHLKGIGVDEPVGTVSAGGNHSALVAAFLYKYYGTDQNPKLDRPLGTMTTKDRYGLAMVTIRGVDYVIVDIGMRMLTPREMFCAQGFPVTYHIDTGANGEPITKTQQTHKCGNSVSPHPAAALVAANCAHLREAS